MKSGTNSSLLLILTKFHDCFPMVELLLYYLTLAVRLRGQQLTPTSRVAYWYSRTRKRGTHESKSGLGLGAITQRLTGRSDYTDAGTYFPLIRRGAHSQFSVRHRVRVALARADASEVGNHQ